MRSFRIVLPMTLVLALAAAPVLADAAGLLLNLARLVTPRPGSGQLAKLDFTLDEDFGPDAIAWSPDGKYIADTGSLSSIVNIWSVAERRVIHHIDSIAISPAVHPLAFSPDSKWLAFCSYGALRVFTVEDWRAVDVHNQPRGSCGGHVEFSDDGTELVVWNSKNLVFLNTVDWTVKKEAKSRYPDAFAFLPNTHDLLFGGTEFDFEHPDPANPSHGGALWLLAEGETTPSRRITAYPTDSDFGNLPVTYIAISRNGRQLATGTLTGNGPEGHVIRSAVRILDFPSGTIVASPLDGIVQSHQSGIAYSKDGNYLIVADDNPHSPRVHLIATSSLIKVDTIELSWSARDVAANPIGNGFAVATGTRIGIWRIH